MYLYRYNPSYISKSRVKAASALRRLLQNRFPAALGVPRSTCRHRRSSSSILPYTLLNRETTIRRWPRTDSTNVIIKRQPTLNALTASSNYTGRLNQHLVPFGSCCVKKVSYLIMTFTSCLLVRFGFCMKVRNLIPTRPFSSLWYYVQYYMTNKVQQTTWFANFYTDFYIELW